MRVTTLMLALPFAIGACSPSEKTTYNNSPLLQASSDYSDYRIGETWYEGQWRIAPEIAHDTLKVMCYNSKESFEFRTDSDTIQFDIAANTTQGFYVQLNDSTYAHTVIQGVAFQTNSLSFDDSRNPDLSIAFQTEPSPYLKELSTAFPLDFIDSSMSDTEVVLAVLNWTHNRWDHDGNNSPSKGDAITILNEAQEGQRFPCFAYAIVLRDQLNALGYSARTVYLKTQDAEHRQSSPGHVATEVYLKDLQKWVFVDGQFNIMPFLNGQPLHAVELQDAIGNHYDEFELRSMAEEITTKKNYVNFVYDYLYYFDTTLDNRYEIEEWNRVDGKSSIMLVPTGGENLTHIDFWDSDIDYCVYTNSVADFYATPG